MVERILRPVGIAAPHPQDTSKPVISLLTDYGPASVYVGQLKAVIISLNPSATIVDLAHDIPPQDIRAGAFALAASCPFFPPNTIHVAVVDPGVGTARRPIAVRCRHGILIGPDNGLLSWAAHNVLSAQSRPSSLDTAVELNNPDYWLQPVSETFHGRDIFAPVAAHLSRGATLEDVGSSIDSIETMPFPIATVMANRIEGEVVFVDRYGNLVTSVREELLAGYASTPRVIIGSTTLSGLAKNYEGEGPRALVGSFGYLEIAVPNGSASSDLGASVGSQVTISV